MTSRRQRPGKLALRLLLSHTVVVICGATAFVLVAGLVVPGQLDARLAAAGVGVTLDELAPSLAAALTGALGVGLAVAGVAAAIASAALAVRIARPVEHLAAAAAAIEQGDSDARAPIPGADDELRTLALAFNAMAERLSSTETSRRRLLRDLTHELRTPLATIEGYLEGIRDGVVASDEHTLTIMDAAASRLHRLVDDVADVSRADEGVLELRRERVDLCLLVRDAVDQRQSGGDAGPIHVGGDTNTVAELMVDADPDRVVQILTNLLDNAHAHTPHGTAVTVMLEGDPDWATVTVHDNGPGIAPHDLPHVFDRFYRAETSREVPGSGLGLAIARSLARAHGGDILAYSQGAGTGTSFVLTLPRARPK